MQVMENWLPDMDLNHDKQIQSLLCYHYTIGHPGVWTNVRILAAQSSS
jgi:hypothetical protein